MYEQRLVLLGIAQGGVYGNGQTFSVQIPDYRLSPYFGELLEGGIVLDKRDIPIDILIKHVVNGPMLDLSIPKNSFRPFVKGGTHEYQGETLKGFDFVGLDVYLQLCREIGTKIGFRRGNNIEWESGEVTPIPEYETRYERAA